MGALTGKPKGIEQLAIDLFNESLAIQPAIVYSGVVAGVIGLVAVFGLWKARRRGMILTIIVSVFNMLSAAPGLLGATNRGLQVTAGVYVSLSVLIIVLVVLPSARQTYADERVSGTAVR
jgi:hypothetical protein